MKKIKESFLLLSPFLTIKANHLNKRDVRNIKISLSFKMGVVCLIIAILLLVVSLTLFFSMGIETNWSTAEKYGITSFVAQIIAISSSSFVAILEFITIKIKNKNIKVVLARLGSIILYVSLATYLFLSFNADATTGYLNDSPTLSASISLITFLIIIQPVFWTELVIFDVTVSFSLIFCSVFYAANYNMQGLVYYLLLGIIFPIGCYVIVSILFYAESLRYCELLRNEILNNKAKYDELTHCKNRYSLDEYIEESIKRWSFKESNLLMIMFDLDNFKQYNDQYSHLGGDYCLKAIGDGIRKEFPAPDLDFFRYGGEEFLLFFELNTKQEALGIMNRVKDCVENLKIEAPKGAPKDVVTVSVGALYTRVSGSFNYEENLALVDKFLYKAKANGKDICCLNGDLL